MGDESDQNPQESRAVNFVWNYVNELSRRSIREHGRFLSAFDIHKYTNGAGKDLALHLCNESKSIAVEHLLAWITCCIQHHTCWQYDVYRSTRQAYISFHLKLAR